MPVISMFYGIIIAMYFADTKRHKRPHIHVKYQGEEAVYGIPEGARRRFNLRSNSYWQGASRFSID
jgi:Domain of unknown function (DUF4160)